MSQIRIAVIVGSLRKDSINQKLALAVSGMFTERFDSQRVEIADLPLYNRGFYARFPAACVRFKQQVEAADALLRDTSGYNRSVPRLLKNAIDVGSRPGGSNSCAGKLAAVIGTSPGARGAALSHVRNVLVELDVLVMPQPELPVQFLEGMSDGRDASTMSARRNSRSASSMAIPHG